MIYKPYGSTGKNVSAIAFGGMRFANPGDIDANAEIVLHAHQQGVNYFDTAPYYCEDKSEDIMGAAFAQMDRDSFYASTKCGSDDGDEVRASLERSLKRLNLETIDFFHIWCIIRPDQWQRRKDKGAIAAAFQAKEEGLINHVVFSSHMPGGQIREIIDEGQMEGVTLGYCAINFPFRQEALDAAARAGIGVVAMNPLGGGVIPNNAERFGFIQGPDDPDVTTAALRFVVSQPAISAALVGFTTTEQIDQAVAAVKDFEPYPAGHIEKIKADIEEGFDQLCTGCGYCLPCPQELEVPKLMDTYNQIILEGNTDAAKGRLKWHWGIQAEVANECIECGACEQRCTQSLPIIERLKEIAALAD